MLVRCQNWKACTACEHRCNHMAPHEPVLLGYDNGKGDHCVNPGPCSKVKEDVTCYPVPSKEPAGLPSEDDGILG